MFSGVNQDQLPYAQDVPISTADHVTQIHFYFSILSDSRIWYLSDSHMRRAEKFRDFLQTFRPNFAAELKKFLTIYEKVVGGKLVKKCAHFMKHEKRPPLHTPLHPSTPDNILKPYLLETHISVFLPLSKRRAQLLGWDRTLSSSDGKVVAWFPASVRNFPFYQKVQLGSGALKTSWSMDTSLSTKDGFFMSFQQEYVRKFVIQNHIEFSQRANSVTWFKVNAFPFQIIRVTEDSSLTWHTKRATTIPCKIERQPASNGTLHTQRVEGMLQYSVLWRYW